MDARERKTKERVKETDAPCAHAQTTRGSILEHAVLVEGCPLTGRTAEEERERVEVFLWDLQGQSSCPTTYCTSLCGQQFVFLDLADKYGNDGSDATVDCDKGLLKRSTRSSSRRVAT
jgi:hypothetical protein